MCWFPSKNQSTLNAKKKKRKTHLLKKLCFTTSIEGPEAMLSESSSPDLKSQSLNVSFNGFRNANINFKTWATKMAALHKPIWIKAEIFIAVMASTKKIRRNTDLILNIAEKWCPKTKTFIFPWGEVTITLEDVMILLGFSVLGLPHFATLDSSGEKIKEKLEKEWFKLKGKTSFVTQVAWIKRFMDSDDDDELEHVAFLALWLSYFVFPSRYYHLQKEVFSIAVHLSRGTKIALAPPVLANLYRDLTLLKKNSFTEKIELTSLFKLVQVWTWERFSELQPKPKMILKETDPRISRWEDSKKQRTRTDVKKTLENSKIEWRPYTKPIENWKLPKFYPEKAMLIPVDSNLLDDEFISFARFIKVVKLVGIDSIEDYFPNRVASQFGLVDQDVPCSVNEKNLSKEAAWDEYNKPIDDLTLYIPSRDTSNSVLSRSKKYMKRIRENDESTIDNDDDEDDDSLTIAQVMRLKKKKKYSDDVKNNGRDAFDQIRGDETRSKAEMINDVLDKNKSSDLTKLLSSSAVIQKLGEGFHEKLKRSRSRRTMKNVRFKIGNCGGSASREVPLSEANDEEEETGSKGEEITVLISANEKIVSNGGEVGIVVSPQKAKETYDDEIDVNGINAEKKKKKKKSMVDDGTREAECLFYEDREKQRRKEKEGDDYNVKLKNRKLAIEKIALNLEERIMKMEKTLAKIRIWKTRRNEVKNGVSA